ncbi:MAG TPA: tetratricopeptide repeat protein [Dongiaceae bacterium]|nr:tetratricopeptide repeat protein [Dongiaceae bacterium]
MADIFHEVEEDLRRDQAAAIWKKYGNYIVGAALLLVLAVAAHWGWTKYSTNQQMQASADFQSAASTRDLKAREAALDKIAAEGGTYGVLARFRLAETAIEGSDKAKARGILGEIAKDGGADKALRDLALIQAALLELEIGKPETAADLVKDLTKENEPYRLSALEVTGLAAMATGDTAKAKTTFETLKKTAETEAAGGAGFVQRADQMLDRLGN